MGYPRTGYFNPSVAERGRWASFLGESEMAITEPESDCAPSIADLYRSHSRWLRAVIRRRAGHDGAEDVVQETFQRLAASDNSAPWRHPKAFLLKIAQNVLHDKTRNSGTAKRMQAENIFLDSPALGSTDQFETVLLKQVVLALPTAQREVFLLSRFGGLTYEEIAKACGISVKTVEWRMAKAIARCASKLRE